MSKKDNSILVSPGDYSIYSMIRIQPEPIDSSKAKFREGDIVYQKGSGGKPSELSYFVVIAPWSQKEVDDGFVRLRPATRSERLLEHY
jgi:hypothetical protein